MKIIESPRLEHWNVDVRCARCGALLNIEEQDLFGFVQGQAGFECVVAQFRCRLCGNRNTYEQYPEPSILPGYEDWLLREEERASVVYRSDVDPTRAILLHPDGTYLFFERDPGYISFVVVPHFQHSYRDLMSRLDRYAPIVLSDPLYPANGLKLCGATEPHELRNQIQAELEHKRTLAMSQRS